MISYLPEIYPDELVYSWFCRYYVHSGCLTYKMALDDILYKRCNNPSKEFLGHLNPEMQKKIQEIYSIEQLILQHTMFPQYARFIPLDQKKKALYHLCFDFRDIHHLFSVLPRANTDQYMKYCPLCAEEDRQKYGETYWHRTHQLRNMQICHIHYCNLEISTVTVKSEQTYTFCPAEEYITVRSPAMTYNALSQQYAEYMAAVFHSPISLSTDIPISAVFYHAMSDTRYMAISGKARHTKQLAEDINAYFKSIGTSNIASIYQIQRVLLGNRYDFSVICQIAHYLGMSVDDLTAPKLTYEQMVQEEKAHYIRDRPPLDWDEYDNEISPLLEQLAKDIYDGTASDIGRPERVSEKAVYRVIGLSGYGLKNLPKCKTIFERYYESYEETWARRIVWAYNKIKSAREKDSINWSDIRAISGVKKARIDKVIPFIYKYTDRLTAAEIIRLLQ